MDYVELSQAIQDYANNQESTFLESIPMFIKQAEERICRSVMIPELRKTATLTATIGSQYITRPGDFIAPFSFAVSVSGNYTFLLPKEVSFIRAAYPSSATQTVPRYYAEFSGVTDASSGTFILGPTPDLAYTFELNYYYNPPSITTANTSWLGDNASSALLYGSLVEAYVFMKGDADLLGAYTSRYQEALQLAFGVGKRLRRDDFRDGQAG